MTKKTAAVINWLDEHLLFVLTGFLAVFIPLYPKLPLFDAIPGYIVRVRLEDIFILFTTVFWLIQVKRKKVTWKTPLTYGIVAYAVVGLLSTISGVLITKTIPFELLHIGKSLLHYFRYLEYFSLFFITYSAVKTKKHLQILVAVMALTLFCVFVYGVGQRHLYWPVYSTMNREFSKGMRLYLTEHARVQSTFGGHYDLGAYLVILMPIVAGAAFGIKNKLAKIGLWIAFTGSLWLLMLSASRTSLGSYAITMAVVLVGFASLQPSFKRGLGWFISRTFWVGFLTWITLAQFGSSMYERILQTLEAYPEANALYHNINRERKEFFFQYLPEKIVFLKDIKNWQFFAKKPDNGIPIDDVLVTSDERPVAERPDDVYVDVPDIKNVATVSAEGVESIIKVEVPRTYSENAFKHGLSLAIRLDTLWPRALAGFYANPLFGTGYATLTKENTEQFTEAESTDNNYLRTLGETGALGFITFYGIISTAIFLTLHLGIRKAVVRARSLGKLATKESLLDQGLMIGFVAATLGLLINAIYIDVFAASKVALTFWMVTGATVALLEPPKAPAEPPSVKRRKH